MILLEISKFAVILNGGCPRSFRLDDAELIHMNGRAYDYNLGRFLSVDPFLQSPGNSQSMNPYSYIMNNPLSGVDPSGYLSRQYCAVSGGEGCDSFQYGQRPGAKGYGGAAAYTGNNGKSDSTSALDTQKKTPPSGQGAPATRSPVQQNPPQSQKKQSSQSSNAGTNSSLKKDVKLDKKTEKKVIEMRKNMSNPQSDTEEKYRVKSDGNTTPVSNAGCTLNDCTVEVSSTDKALGHLHVVQGNIIATKGRELPGPGDHQVVVQYEVPNVIYTPSGRIVVVERVNGEFTARTIYGGRSSSNRAIDREYGKLMKRTNNNPTDADIGESVRSLMKRGKL